MKRQLKEYVVPESKDEGEETREVVASEDIPTHFSVIVKNTCSYPIRIIIFMDEQTGHATYSVMKQFEERQLDINFMTLRYLQMDSKIRLTRLED